MISGGDTGWRVGATINAFWWGYRVEGGCNPKHFLVGIQGGGGGGVTINAFWWGYRVEGGGGNHQHFLVGIQGGGWV